MIVIYAKHTYCASGCIFCIKTPSFKGRVEDYQVVHFDCLTHIFYLTWTKNIMKGLFYFITFPTEILILNNGQLCRLWKFENLYIHI